MFPASDFLADKTHRPLLRVGLQRDANAIDVAAYGGVILRGSAPVTATEVAFARECREKNLGVWIDLSTLAAPREEFRKQRLVFDGLSAHFEIDCDELDTMHPQSAAVAIEVLEALCGVLSGALFDSLPCAWSTPAPPFPWSPHLPRSFQARHGFNILNRIETLVSSSGDEAARVRQQFWDEVHRAEQENFIAPVSSWLEERNLTFCVRNFRAEYHALALDESLRARLDESTVTLEGARHFPAALAENSEFNTLARAGVSLFEREYSSRFASAPDVQWNQSIARATAAIAQTKNAARVGVLFPARSAQTHYHPDGHRFTRWVGDDLKLTTHLLDDLHFDWLVVSEDQIIQSELRGSTLLFGSTRHELQMIVVPSVTALSWQVWQKLEQFVEAGGKVACMGLLPRWSERGRDRALEELIGKTTRIVVEDLYQAYAALEGEVAMPPTIGYPIFREYHSGGRLCCYQPQLNADVEDARLRVRQILHESLTPVFETLAPEIRYTHRTLQNGDLFFVANEGEQTRMVNARLRPYETGAPLEFNATTGEVTPLFVAMPYSADEGGGIGVSFELAPQQSRFIAIEHANLESRNLLERATFEVEDFDGETATGYMLRNGTAQVALRRDGTIQWHTGDDVVVPIPVLMDGDEWNETPLEGTVEYSQSITVPVDWKNCRVILQVAASHFPVQCIVNDGATEIRLSAPFRFDITLLLAFGASNDITLRAWTQNADYQPVARLVAYPTVAVKITP